jgi:hypothetical protein
VQTELDKIEEENAAAEEKAVDNKILGFTAPKEQEAGGEVVEQ